MANSKISALPAAGALAGTEPAAIVQAAATKQTTVQAIADLALSGKTVLAAGGTKTAPAYSWLGAPTLGVYFRAGRIFCLTNGTQERFNVDSSGTVSLGQQINFGSADYSTTGGNAILRSPSAAVFSLGNVDAASPVAQKLTVQGVVAGTTNTAGTDWTLAGSVGTGTGAGGSLIFQVAPAGTTGSAQNALATALTIRSTKEVDFAGHQQMTEITAPAAGAANTVRIYAQDNGAGKTQLMALFASGAAQQIAIEP